MVPYSRAAVFGSCLAILFRPSLCVVYRSQPTSTSNCTTACGSGVSVNNACLVLGSNSSVYINFGNVYSNTTQGPFFCVTPSTSSANFSCVCAESPADYRTVPLSAGTNGDCASTCLSGNDLRNTSWTFQNSFGTLGANQYMQYGYALCNVSQFSWGEHRETKIWQRATTGNVSVVGLNGYLGPVLQDWTDNGTSTCSVPYVDQSTYTADYQDYSNGTDCLCVSFLTPMVAENFNASDLPNQAYTSRPLPALAAAFPGNLQGSPSTAALPPQSNAPPASSPGSALGPSSTSPSAAPAGALPLAPAAPVLPIPQASSSNTGAIVGGVVGGVIAALALAGLIFCLVRRRVRKAAGSTLEDDNPWAVKEEKPFWKKLLAPTSRQSTAATNLDSDVASMQTGMSYFTQDVKPLKSIPLASQTQTNYGLMRVADLDLLAAGTATAALRQQEASRNTSSGSLPSANSPSISTKDTIAMVDSDLPVQLRNTWQINLDQLQLVMDAQQRPVTLGKGAYGTVYLGILDGVRKVAVKVVNSPTQRHQKRFVQEIATLRACYDSNIVSFLGASVQEGNTLLVMEYMANGNLWDTLQHDSSNEFRWYGRGRKIALDITAGMSFLHRNDIVHLDLKSPNVLLDENNKAHVADIGLGKMLAGQDALASAATFFWAAPEQLQAQPVSKASDIFSLGVIIWEIITGDQPLQRVYRDVRVPEDCPAEIAAMLTACLSTNPAERPTINQVYKTMRDAPQL